jgi:hypothetical protein
MNHGYCWILDSSGQCILDRGYWIWILDSRYLILDYGYLIMDTGYWIMDKGFCWILGWFIMDSGFYYWILLDTGFCWILDSRYWILDILNKLDTGFFWIIYTR